MRPRSKNLSWLCLLILVGLSRQGTSAVLHPAEIQGYKIFDSVTGEEVVIRGIDYYPRPNKGDLNQNSVDYFTEEHRTIWERDIQHFENLGINAIRLYAVDHEADHDAFMCALAAAGIYVIVPLAHDCPTCAITRDQAPDCYPPELKEQGQAVINAFAKFPNTLAFSTGNEVNHFTPLDKPEWNAPCQKKFLRDMREYVDSCSNSMRKVPVGVVLADSDREKNAMYYNCRGDPDDDFETAEWYGLNSYVFCDGTANTYEEARGLKSLGQDFDSYNYSIPVLLTEFGCLSDSFQTSKEYEGQRNFNQAKWMLERPELRDQFAGGFAFEYSMEKSNAGQESPYPFTKFGHQSYGLGYLSPEDCDDVAKRCEYNPLPNFENLKKVYQEANIVNITNRDDFAVPVHRRNDAQCPEGFPSIDSFEWEADSTHALSCPSKRQSSSFTCAASFGVRIGSSANSHGVPRTNGDVPIALAIVVFGALLAFIVLRGEAQNDLASYANYLYRYFGYHGDGDKLDKGSSIDHAPSTDESTGLLHQEQTTKTTESSSTPYKTMMGSE